MSRRLNDMYGPVPEVVDGMPPSGEVSWFWRVLGALGALSALVLLVAIGALVAAALAASDSHKAVHKLNKLLGLHPCVDEVSTGLELTTLNVVRQAEAGSNPPDTIIAVGNNDDVDVLFSVTIVRSPLQTKLHMRAFR